VKSREVETLALHNPVAGEVASRRMRELWQV
jgi:hypothetical protein